MTKFMKPLTDALNHAIPRLQQLWMRGCLIAPSQDFGFLLFAKLIASAQPTIR